MRGNKVILWICLIGKNLYFKGYVQIVKIAELSSRLPASAEQQERISIQNTLSPPQVQRTLCLMSVGISRPLI